MISAVSVVLAIIWTSIFAVTVAAGGGEVGEGSGAEKLRKEPEILSEDDLGKIKELLGANHVATTRSEYAIQMAKYKVTP